MVSIILIVGAGIGVLSVLLLVALIGVINQLATNEQMPSDLMNLMVFAIIMGVVGGAVDLVVGIMGVKNAAKPEKANMLIVMGIGLCVLQLASMIISLKMYQDLAGLPSGVSSSPVTGILGFALPVLFLIGAVNLRKQARGVGSHGW